MTKIKTRRHADIETRRLISLPRIAASPRLRVLTLLFVCTLAISSFAQTRQRGAHSITRKDSFTSADRRLVEKAIGATCAERIRDPQGSMSID